MLERNCNGISAMKMSFPYKKADRQARKSGTLLKRDFRADKPLTKCVTDMTEIKAKDP